MNDRMIDVTAGFGERLYSAAQSGRDVLKYGYNCVLMERSDEKKYSAREGLTCQQYV